MHGSVLLSKAKKTCMSHQNTPSGTQVCPAGPELMADPGPIQPGVVSVALVLWSNSGPCARQSSANNGDSPDQGSDFKSTVCMYLCIVCERQSLQGTLTVKSSEKSCRE